MKAGTSRTNVINLATALHRDALALELHAAPGWTSRKFGAIEAWPENMELWREWEEIYTGGSDRDKETRRSGDKETRQENSVGRGTGISLSPCLPVSLSSPASMARSFFDELARCAERTALASATLTLPVETVTP